MAMKEPTRRVLKYLQENQDKDLTAADIAAELEMEKRQVDGIFTSALQRKEYGYREPAEIELADGSHQKVKFLRLNESGMELDPDAED